MKKILFVGILLALALVVSAKTDKCKPHHMATTTYTTPGTYTYTVPQGCTSLTFVATGAAGGRVTVAGEGSGGVAIGTLSVTPGTNYYIGIGGKPTDTTGGFNGGGNGYRDPNGPSGGAGGGGMTHIQTVSGVFSQANAVIVAGGGGGRPVSFATGGNGGGTTGGTGFADTYGGTLTPAYGGTQSAGGVGGIGLLSSGTDGSAGLGGNGGLNWARTGGGGGGYYGGGGSGVGDYQFNYRLGGGGGGSSYLSPSLTNASTYEGTNTGDGSLIIYATHDTKLSGVTLQGVTIQ